jgi:Lon protease-like protein
MANELEELPLFPLDTVVFPHATLQLHIFEPRYRDMVRLCLEYDRPFGIVLIRSGSAVGGHADPYLVGTVVKIVKVVHTYEDGRMDIQVHGERRFRIRRLDDSRSYLVGFVEPVQEMELRTGDDADEVFLKAREDFEILVRRLFERSEFSVQVVFPPDPVALSFTIANLLHVENIEKQRLLETTDTVERVQDLLPILHSHLQEAGKQDFYKLTQDEMREWIHPN